MRKIKLFIQCLSFICVSLFVGLLINNGEVSAATQWSSPVVKKALMTGVDRCYHTNAISTSAGPLSTFSGFRSLIVGGTGGNYIALPTGLTDIDDSGVSCEQLFMGYSGAFGVGGSFEGVFELANRNANPTASTRKIALLEGMGYTEVKNAEKDAERCVAFTYNETIAGGSAVEVQTDTICATLDNEGIITDLRVDNLGSYAIQPSSASGSMPFFQVIDNKIRFTRATVAPQYQGMPPTYYGTARGVGDPWDGSNGFLADLRSSLSARGTFTYKYSTRGATLTYTYALPGGTTADNYDDAATSDVSYAIQNEEMDDSFVGPMLPAIDSAARKAINYLSGSNLSLDFSDSEKISLLMASMKSYYFAGLSDSDFWVCDVSDWVDYGAFTADYEIHVTPSGTVNKNCRLNSSQVKNTGTIHGFSGNRFDASGSTNLTLTETIAEINRLVGELPDDVEEVVTPPASVEDSDGSEATCYNATSLSWILCAVIDLTGNTTNAIYTDIKDNYLEIGASEMAVKNSDGGDNGVYFGWKIFRDIANVIFVIMLIIVIFSQITGFGLSNYGIKKVLPTLIMVAVLVNLSFILCQIAVDATNILGDALQSTFVAMGKQIGASENTFTDNLGKILGSIGIVLTGVGATAGVLTLTGGFNVGNALILILLTVITTVISIIFFFVILAVRKAGVLILVTLSPVAIICYALPNTKKFFDKWFRLFTSLLVVYPVCSLLMGAGDFFSKILMTTGAGFMQSLTAVLLQVVPFFLVPSMVKGSLALAGNIGDKISRAGKRLGGRAAGSFARSDAANRMKVSANQWGRTGGMGRALRKIPVVGGVVKTGDRVAKKLGSTAAGKAIGGKVRDSKLGKVAQANRARKNALAKDAYDKMQRQDTNMIRRAELSGGDTLANALATDDQKLMEELANDEFNSINQNGSYQTSDGKLHNVNTNDVEDLSKAVATLEADYQNYQGNTPEDKIMRDKIMIRINGMKKLLQTRYGSKGNSQIAESIYGLAYEADGKTLSQDPDRIAAASRLAQQFVKDDKLMAELHRNDPGSEQFLIDLANRNLVDGQGNLTAVAVNARKNLANGRAGYGNLSAGKVKAANLADSTDTLIANWSKMDASSSEFAQMAATFTQAISDYRTGSNFKEKDIAKINEELKRGYDALQAKWLQNQANIQTLTGYADDGNGNMVEFKADGIDANGDLVRNIVNSSGQVVGTEKLRASASASAPAMSAKSAYSRQVEAFLPVKVGQPQFKIQQPREMPKMPEGYDADGHWDYAAMQRVETKRDKLAYENWVKRSLEVEQQNREAAKMNADLAREQEAYELKIQQQRQQRNNNNP